MNIKKYILPQNGLTVVLCSLPKTMQACVHCSYLGVGSSIECRRSYRGVAHILEHMIFKGTKQRRQYVDSRRVHDILQLSSPPRKSHYGVDEARELILKHSAPDSIMNNLVGCGVSLNLGESDIDHIGRQFGAKMNAFTSSAITSYYFCTTKGNIKPFLAILGDSMQNIHLTDDMLASEMKAVMQELKMGSDNAVRQAMEIANLTLFPPGTCGHVNTIGDELIVARTRANYLRDFYDTNYHPHTCTISVVGDFDEHNIMSAIESTFGAIGVDEYQYKKAVDEIAVGDEVPHALERGIRSLDNESYKKKLINQVEGLKHAHESQANVSYDALKTVQSLPGTSHRVVYDHVAVETALFAFEIPGWNQKGDHNNKNNWDAVQELLCGTASARLPSHCFCFAERHKEAGAFYIFSQRSDDNTLQTIKNKIREPITTKDAERVQYTLVNNYNRLKENVMACADNLVHTMKMGEMPSEPNITTSSLQWVMQQLRGDRIHRVTIKPAINENITQDINRRRSTRSNNASMLSKIKKRVTDVEPASINALSVMLPEIQRLKTLEIPQKYMQRPDQQGFFHVNPYSKIAHFIRVTSKEESRGLDALASNIMAQTLHYNRAGPHMLEKRGASFEMGPNSLSLTQPLNKNYNNNVKALIQRAKQHIEPQSFEQQRARIINSLKNSQKDALGSAMHEATNRFLRRDDEKFAIDTAIKYVSKLTPEQARDIYNDHMSVYSDLFIRPQL